MSGAGSAHCCFFAASIGVNAAVNTRAGTSLPVDKGAYGPILFRASACGRKPFGRTRKNRQRSHESASLFREQFFRLD
jgi:hypothetical protein